MSYNHIIPKFIVIWVSYTGGKADTEEAIKSYELAIKYNPNYDIAYNNLGVIYLDDLGRVNRAIELFRKAIESNPSYALAHFNLARATSIIGDKIEAAKLYQMAQDINKVTQEIDPRDILQTKLVNYLSHKNTHFTL